MIRINLGNGNVIYLLKILTETIFPEEFNYYYLCNVKTGDQK